MPRMSVTVKVAEIDYFKHIGEKLGELLNQIEINDYKDSHGHDLKMNKAYCDLLEHISDVIETN